MGCSGFPKCRYARPLENEKMEVPEKYRQCPKCGGEVVVRRSRRGPFLGCGSYPDCDFTMGLTKDGKPADELLPEDLKVCPQCNSPTRIMRGRRGYFIGCTGYPQCKFTAPLPKKG